jgi:imidazolonepropionase-like amidohydrolase
MGSYLDTLLHWRAELHRRPTSGPRIIWSSPMLDGSPSAWRHGIPLATPEAARAIVDSMHVLGFDFLKVYSRLPRDVYAAIADRARHIGMPFAGHVPNSITPGEAADAGQRSIEHQTGIYQSCVPGAKEEREAIRAAGRAGAPKDSIAARQRRLRARFLGEYDAAACDRLFETFRARGTWQTPTLVVIRGDILAGDTAMAKDPRRAFMPSALTARWDKDGRERDADEGAEVVAYFTELYRREVRLTGAMHRAGVRILVGTDASDEPNVYPGSGVHDELELLVEAGLTPAEALAAATTGPAEYLGLRDSLGTLETGRVADMVILDANPLADIRNIRHVHAVVSQGRLIDQAARTALLDSARVRAARAVPSPPAAQ